MTAELRTLPELVRVRQLQAHGAPTEHVLFASCALLQAGMRSALTALGPSCAVTFDVEVAPGTQGLSLHALAGGGGDGQRRADVQDALLLLADAIPDWVVCELFGVPGQVTFSASGIRWWRGRAARHTASAPT